MRVVHVAITRAAYRHRGGTRFGSGASIPRTNRRRAGTGNAVGAKRGKDC
jgi:hypothetical protein